jgi:hypothetical protein
MFWVALYFFLHCLPKRKDRATGQHCNICKKTITRFFNDSKENTNNSHRLHKFTVLNKLRFCLVRIGNYRLTKLLITFKMN